MATVKRDKVKEPTTSGAELTAPPHHPVSVRDGLYREAQSFYAKLLDTGESESAKRIWQACDVLHKAANKTITAAAVGQYCISTFGGPRTQSISNKPTTLGKLVKMWDGLARADHGRPSKVAHRSPIIEIEDPTLAEYVRVLQQELFNHRRALIDLQAAVKRAPPLGVPDAASQVQEVIPPPTRFASEEQRAAVRNFLSYDHLQRCEMRLDDRGRIVYGESGVYVFADRLVVEVLKAIAGS